MRYWGLLFLIFPVHAYDVLDFPEFARKDRSDVCPADYKYEISTVLHLKIPVLSNSKLKAL